VDAYSVCMPSFRFAGTAGERRLLTKRSEPITAGSCDNADHDLILRVGDILEQDASMSSSVGSAPGLHSASFTFEVLDFLGQGSFGQVVRCKVMDRADAVVAVKVIKNHSAYLHQAKTETKILEFLGRLPCSSSASSTGTCCAALTCGPCRVVHLLQSIECKQHLCLAFELLSSSLYDVVKQTQFKGMRLELVREIVTQVRKRFSGCCCPAVVARVLTCTAAFGFRRY
jgi:dual specificity protein kinase YAK1